MRRTAALLAAWLLAGLLLATACGDGASDRIEVRIGRLGVDAELALTSDIRARGLGGRESLPRDQGMLFVFARQALHLFWMKDMLIPLDFVWISADRRVVDLTLDVPPPAPGTPDRALPGYRPRAEVPYVLEVNAGLVAETGVQVGDQVHFDRDPPAVVQ